MSSLWTKFYVLLLDKFRWFRFQGKLKNQKRWRIGEKNLILKDRKGTIQTTWIIQPHDLCTGQSLHAVLCSFGPAAFERSGLHTEVSLLDTNQECEGSLQLELWWQEQQNVLWTENWKMGWKWGYDNLSLLKKSDSFLPVTKFTWSFSYSM